MALDWLTYTVLTFGPASFVLDIYYKEINYIVSTLPVTVTRYRPVYHFLSCICKRLFLFHSNIRKSGPKIWSCQHCMLWLYREWFTKNVSKVCLEKINAYRSQNLFFFLNLSLSVFFVDHSWFYLFFDKNFNLEIYSQSKCDVVIYKYMCFWRNYINFSIIVYFCIQVAIFSCL